jgi:uncharacterized membrane protein YfcA
MLINILGLLFLGCLTGTLSGLLGIGGGSLITPTLVYLFGFSQHTAQGTTLALLVPPVGLIAAWAYYQQGFVDLKVSALLCIGFVIGSLLGAKFAIDLPEVFLKRVFGTLTLIIALKMLLNK